eukprot:TRINITY_DN1763_c0_g2_i1.p1 TRINITY_DN1763_c0_g2~~TRINITY_DN1763_c0_g2_i1.p1  ORF type:complete len:224 (-),score=17.32 TRINITY_DN1763_c0_g2_i1:86-757(-)
MMALELESYSRQKDIWPKVGRHILAQYDDDTVIVYQAFRKEIAEYAVANQKFGGPLYDPGRMTWVKTNFLWMMYRSNWGLKDPNQECTLAIRLTRQFFEYILSLAEGHSGEKDESVKESRKAMRVSKDSYVRLQWDPDHTPKGGSHPGRRAIQLGLKRLDQLLSGEGIVSITDISDYVKEQIPVVARAREDEKAYEDLMVPRERVYTLLDPSLAAGISLDPYP